MSVLSVYDATRGWLYHNQGFRNDLDFWSTYSGLTGHNSWTTHADFALTKNGYTGSLNDKLIKWASDLTGHTDWTFNDNVLYFFKSMPSGLTFFKNYASIPAQTAADATLLNANLSVGSGVATFTSTDGNFTITSNGYQATTANAEVLKYLIAGNRTAAQETIVIKFMLSHSSNEAATTVAFLLTNTETKGRKLYLESYLGTIANTWKPNINDNVNCTGQVLGAGAAWTENVNYVWAGTAQHISPYVELYINNSLKSSETVDDFTNNNWGTYFYVGADANRTSQLDGWIKAIYVFNRRLTSGEISLI